MLDKMQKFPEGEAQCFAKDGYLHIGLNLDYRLVGIEDRLKSFMSLIEGMISQK